MQVAPPLEQTLITHTQAILDKKLMFVVLHYQYIISVLVLQTCQKIAGISSISLVHRMVHQILSQIGLLSEKKTNWTNFIYTNLQTLCVQF